MATTELPLHSVADQHSTQPSRSAGAIACAVLTFLALLVHGYHPYAEDGGVYLAGIKRVLNPRLYPQWSGFVTTHMKFSLFAPGVAWLARITHAPLMVTLLIVYVGCTWLTLFAGWLLMRRLGASIESCAGAVAVVAMCLTIPVAGTSLMLMDPYVTARSISTPCGLLMLVAALDIEADWKQRRVVAWRSIALLGGSLLVAAAVHPLMAAYALGCVLLLACMSIEDSRVRLEMAGVMCLLAIALAAGVQGFSHSVSPGYAEVARSRTYWFLGMWRWYELIGLAGPVLVLLLLWRRGAGRRLAAMALVAGGMATVVAVLFARAAAPSYAVAMLQPLRIYQMVYLLMLLALGAAAAEFVLKRSGWRWAVMLAVLGGLMAFVQRETFPDSAHIELPWRAPGNAWEQAFLWVRGNTPADAAFAMDANYISAPGEDSQNFRAIAERSAMPDYAKDGGIAAIAPALTPQWIAGVTAQAGLDRGMSFEQMQRLRAAGVTWVVVTRDARAPLACAYANAAVKVCRLP